MTEAGEKSYHFNSNTRLNSGSKASMANNEDPFIRALEIQERKREIREQELERQRKLQELENPTPPAADENTEAQEEQQVAVEETAATEVEQSAPNKEEGRCGTRSSQTYSRCGSFFWSKSSRPHTQERF